MELSFFGVGIVMDSDGKLNKATAEKRLRDANVGDYLVYEDTRKCYAEIRASDSFLLSAKPIMISVKGSKSVRHLKACTYCSEFLIDAKRPLYYGAAWRQKKKKTRAEIHLNPDGTDTDESNEQIMRARVLKKLLSRYSKVFVLELKK